MNPQPDLIELGLSKSLETAINTAIHLDEQQGMLFDQLDGKTIELQINPFEKALFCIINQRQALFQNQLQGEADATLKTEISSFIGLPLGEKLEAEVCAGDTAAGEAFVDALNKIEIDWEEHLSHYTGDLLAFKIGHGFRSTMAAKQQTKEYIGETLKEYLLYELEALPAKHQVEHFIEDVNELQKRVEEAAKRLEKLANR